MNAIRRLAVDTAAAAILAGCHPSAPPPDPYDQSKTDFRSTPAKVFVAAPRNGAFDPRRANLENVQERLDRRLAGMGLSLLVMRVMDSPDDLAAVRRR